MPKKKLSFSKSTFTLKNALIATTTAAIVTVGGAAAYSKIADKLVKVPLGGNGRGFGVYWDNDGQPHVEFGGFGCCSPYCSDMSELECSREYGHDGTFHPGARCDYDVPECREGCCLPSCQEVPKVQCEGDYGYGDGGWLPSACTDVPECEVGCCNLEGVKKQEMKAPCEEANGTWTQGECKTGFTVDIEGTSTYKIGQASITQTTSYHLYTCGNTVNSIWHGSYTTTTNGKTINGTAYLDFETTPGKTNQVEETAGTIRMDGTVNESKMDLSYSAGSMINWSASAPVEQGASECQ